MKIISTCKINIYIQRHINNGNFCDTHLRLAKVSVCDIPEIQLHYHSQSCHLFNYSLCSETTAIIRVLSKLVIVFMTFSLVS